MKQILEYKEIIGKTIQAMHSFDIDYYEKLILQFTDETFAVFTGSGDDDSACIDFLGVPLPTSFRVSDGNDGLNRIFIELGLRTQVELDEFLADADRERKERQRIREEQNKPIEERFPTLAAKGVYIP